ncbi:MAG: YitT family protein [Tissierellia bacterium]|nr:YitT family protein [Tissierellia bacterium]
MAPESARKVRAIIIGNLLCALAITLFFKPQKLISGGVGGISVFIEYITEFPAGITVFLLNFPLFIVGYKRLNQQFVTYGFVSAIMFSIFLSLLSFIKPVSLTGDTMLDAIFGGALNGLGMGIMFRNGTCQGGLDIVAALMRKKSNINIGTALMIMNGIIIALASVIFTLRRGLFTLVAMYVAYEILDKIQMGFGESKQIFIVTRKEKEVAKAIQQRIRRGVTFLKGEGGWSHEEHRIILTVVSSRQIVAIKEILNEIDPRAFFTVSDTLEVKGHGFRNADLE